MNTVRAWLIDDPRARRIALAAFFPLFWLFVGTVGYEAIEGWDTFDSAYMTVITLATIGYGESTRCRSKAGPSR